MDFKEYLKEEEERVDEILPLAAKFGQGVASLGRGLVGGVKAAAGSTKQFVVKRAKKKAIEKAGEVAQNTLGREDASRMYITKAGVKFISETDKRLHPSKRLPAGVVRTKPGSGGIGSDVPPGILKPKPKPKPPRLQTFDPAKHRPK